MVFVIVVLTLATHYMARKFSGPQHERALRLAKLFFNLILELNYTEEVGDPQSFKNDGIDLNTSMECSTKAVDQNKKNCKDNKRVHFSSYIGSAISPPYDQTINSLQDVMTICSENVFKLNSIRDFVCILSEDKSSQESFLSGLYDCCNPEKTLVILEAIKSAACPNLTMSNVLSTKVTMMAIIFYNDIKSSNIVKSFSPLVSIGGECQSLRYRLTWMASSSVRSILRRLFDSPNSSDKPPVMNLSDENVVQMKHVTVIDILMGYEDITSTSSVKNMKVKSPRNKRRTSMDSASLLLQHKAIDMDASSLTSSLDQRSFQLDKNYVVEAIVSLNIGNNTVDKTPSSLIIQAIRQVVDCLGCYFMMKNGIEDLLMSFDIMTWDSLCYFDICGTWPSSHSCWSQSIQQTLQLFEYDSLVSSPSRTEIVLPSIDDFVGNILNPMDNSTMTEKRLFLQVQLIQVSG
jgi:hypothetical protein